MTKVYSIALAVAKNGRRPARLAVRAGDIIVRVLRAGAVPVQNNLKMAVAAERAARVAHISNKLPLGDIISL